MTWRALPVYLILREPSPYSKCLRSRAMYYAAVTMCFLIFAPLMLVILPGTPGFGSSKSFPVMTWESSYAGQVFFCTFKGAPTNSGYTACYLPDRKTPIATHSEDGTTRLHAARLDRTRSGFYDDGSAKLQFISSKRESECVACVRNALHRSIQVCLACQAASMSSVPSGRTPSEELIPRFLQSRVEEIDGNRYLVCRFRIHPNTTHLDSAWLNDRCIFTSETTDPVDACAGTPSYISPKQRGTFVTIKARVRENVCRICMVRTEKMYVSLGRVCPEDVDRTILETARIGRYIVIGVWGISTFLLGIASLRLIFSLEWTQRTIKKLFMVGTMVNFVVLVVVAALATLKARGTVVANADVRNVIDIDVPPEHSNVIDVHTLLIDGLELGVCAKFMSEDGLNRVLNR